MKVQLVALKGVPQVLAEGDVRGGLGVHARLEELIGVAAQLLGPDHGRVGVLQQGVFVPAVLRENGDADAGVHHHVLAVHMKRFGEDVEDFGNDGGGVVAVAAFGEQDRELVAGQPRHRIGGVDPA